MRPFATAFFLTFWRPEDGTDTLSQYLSNMLPTIVMQHPRRAKALPTPRLQPYISQSNRITCKSEVYTSAIMGHSSFSLVACLPLSWQKEAFNLVSWHFKKKILALLHDVLNPSDFTFGSQSYIQTDGLSMGLLLSPVIADHTVDSEYKELHHFVFHVILSLIYLTQAFSFHTSTVFTLTTHNLSISAPIIQHYTLATHPLHENPCQCEGPWISHSLWWGEEQASGISYGKWPIGWASFILKMCITQIWLT